MLNYSKEISRIKNAIEKCTDLPNLAFVESILEHKIPSNIITLQNKYGTDAWLLSTNSPFSFIIGEIEVGFAIKAQEKIKNYAKLLFLTPPIIESVTESDFLHGRIQMSHKDANILKSIDTTIPVPGSKILQISANIVEKCIWKDIVIPLYGSPETYEKFCLGYCMMKDGKVISEVHAVLSNEKAEIGSITLPEFRNRSLSKILNALLISHLHDTGKAIYGSRDKANINSELISRSLGYIEQFEYSFIDIVSPKSTDNESTSKQHYSAFKYATYDN